MQTTTDIGFRPQKGTEEDEAKGYERMKNKVLEEVKHTFRPEFLNRVDEVVVFHQLTRGQIEQIVGLELEKVLREVRAQEMELKVTERQRRCSRRRAGIRSSARVRYGARFSAWSKTSWPRRCSRERSVRGDHILADVDPDDPEKLKFSKIPSIEIPSEPSEPAHASYRPGGRKLDPPHRGHAFLIDSARSTSARVIVLVFDYAEQTVPVEQRAAWLREIHPGVDVRILPTFNYARINREDAVREAARVRAFLGEPVDMFFTSEDYGEMIAEEWVRSTLRSIASAHSCPLPAR